MCIIGTHLGIDRKSSIRHSMPSITTISSASTNQTNSPVAASMPALRAAAAPRWSVRRRRTPCPSGTSGATEPSSTVTISAMPLSTRGSSDLRHWAKAAALLYTGTINESSIESKKKGDVRGTPPTLKKYCYENFISFRVWPRAQRQDSRRTSCSWGCWRARRGCGGSAAWIRS